MPESRFFDSDGARIHYIEKGSGEPVVLLHGYSGNVGDWLAAGVFQDLAKDYRVIAFDARGHGKSDKPHDVAAYGSEMALDVPRLLDHLGIERAHIVGFSMGSRVMGRVMVSHPDRFLSAVLAAFAPSWNWSADDQRAIEARRDNLVANPPQRMVEQAEIHDIDALATLLLGFSELAVTDRDLARGTIPTLAIIGSEDRSLERVHALGELSSAVKIVVVEDATHWGPSGLILRSEFIMEVRAFIAEYGTRAVQN